MLVTSPGMKPGAIRVDQLDREQEDEKVIKYPEIGKKHALKKYDQFTQNTSCFWRSTGKILPQFYNFTKFFLYKNNE